MCYRIIPDVHYWNLLCRGKCQMGTDGKYLRTPMISFITVRASKMPWRERSSMSIG
jgi:hypothetical protein